MGKSAKRLRERFGLSSSCFLRCFGFSRKISSDKPIVSSPVDSGYEKMKEKKKKKSTLRSHWFLRSTKIYMKNGESITEMEKRNSSFEDLSDKQKAFIVISHLADREDNGSGDKSVKEEETKEKERKEERDINPDALNIYGDDTCHKEVVSHDQHASVKLDPVKPTGSGSGSGSKPKVRKGTRVKRFDPVIGIIIITLTLMIMLIWGRLCAIICSSTWCYFLPRLKEASAAAKRRRSSCRGEAFRSDLDLNSESYKKKVVLEGFLGRRNRVSL